MGYGEQYAAHHFRTLKRIGCCVAKKHIGLEPYEIHLVRLKISLHLGGRVALCKGIGVVTVGKKKHLYVQSLGKKQVYASQGSLYASRVAVIYHSDIFGKTVDEAYLPLRERGS